MLNSIHKKNRSRKKWLQRWKSIVQINEQYCLWKKMENLRKRMDTKLVSNRKDYLKWTFKQSYMSRKIFIYDLVAIHKNKVTLTLNKPAYIGICI